MYLLRRHGLVIYLQILLFTMGSAFLANVGGTRAGQKTSLSLSSNLADTKPPKVLRVVMDDTYPPYVFRDSSGKIRGILPDQWVLWEKRTGVRVSIEEMDWAKAQETLLKGEADVIDTLFFTREREKLYDFTESYADIAVPIFFHKDISGIEDLSSLKGFVVGVKRGDACIEVLKSRGINTLSFYPSYWAIIQAAKSGAIKIFCMDEPPALYYLNKAGIAANFRRGPTLYFGQLHRAVRKGNTEILNLVNRGFESIPKSALKDIHDRWFGKSLAMPSYHYYFEWILFGFLGLMLISLAWVFSLRRAVRERTRNLEGSRQETKTALKKYTELFERVPVGLFRTTPDGRILEGNSRFAQILGYPSKEEMLKSNMLEHYIDPSERERWKTAVERQGTILNYQHQIRRCDGKLIWVEKNTYAHFDDNGNVLYYEGSTQDISDKIKAEAELRLLATAISQAEESVVITDIQGDIQYVNPAFERITGYRRDEVLGKNPRFLKSGRHDEAFYKGLWDTISRGKVWKGSFVNKRKDGTLYEEGATIRPVMNSDGEITHYVAVKRDVTTQRKLERQLRQAQKMEAIGTLAGGIAHDFNNILSAIMGYSELSLMEAEEGSAISKNIEQVLRAARRARELVKQILAFSRQTEEERKPLQIQPILKEALKMLRSSLPATIDIKQHIDPEAGLIMGDPTQVHQVLMNLCTNAGHAMREKGGTLEVRLENVHVDDTFAKTHRGVRPGPYVCLTVSDTGCGMSRDILERIFDPYFTTKEKGEGTGLGLAVVSGIVRSYGGTITVYSTPGQGSTFHVYFPMLEEDRPLKEREELDFEPLPRGTERILFVDDEEVLVEIGSQMLESLGYNVTCRTSPLEALELFKAKPQAFDLVITDMTMPQMTGDKLAEKFLEIRPDLPIVLCTGFSEKITRQGVRALGIREFLMKPLVLKDLAVAVRKALESTKAKA